MELSIWIADVEREARIRGLSIKEVCRHSGIHLSTFNRWRAGKTAPTFRSLQKIHATLPGIEQTAIELKG